MRTSTAYFAGAGTVLAAIVGGVGGGLLFADMVSPKTPKAELTRLEQRMSAQPIQVKAEPAAAPTASPPPTTVATAPTTEKPLENTAPVTPAPAQAAATQPPTPNVVSTPAAASTAENAPAAPPAVSVPPSEPKASPPAVKQATASDDSYAKAKDVDIKRAATEKRRSERRQQWSEKRRYQQRDPDRELRDVEAKVREETESRPILASEPARAESPRIRLFDLD